MEWLAVFVKGAGALCRYPPILDDSTERSAATGVTADPRWAWTFPAASVSAVELATKPA